MRNSTRSISAIAALALMGACAVDEMEADDTLEAVDEGAIDPEEVGVLDEIAFDSELASLDREVAGDEEPLLCIRGPFGPGKVNWLWSVNGAEWRSEIENGSQWVGAERGEQSTDGIHRNGWGCTVLKIPDHCTADVSSNGSISSCCNAAASIRYGKVRWVDYTEIGAPRPPGC
jgi:hypothetical protein